MAIVRRAAWTWSLVGLIGAGLLAAASFVTVLPPVPAVVWTGVFCAAFPSGLALLAAMMQWPVRTHDRYRVAMKYVAWVWVPSWLTWWLVAVWLAALACWASALLQLPGVPEIRAGQFVFVNHATISVTSRAGYADGLRLESRLMISAALVVYATALAVLQRLGTIASSDAVAVGAVPP